MYGPYSVGRRTWFSQHLHGCRARVFIFAPCRTHKRYKKEEEEKKKNPICGQHCWNSPAENSHFQSGLEASFSRYFQADMNYWKFPLHCFHSEMGWWAIISAERICFLKYNLSRSTNDHQVVCLVLFVSLIALGSFLATWNTVYQKTHTPSTVPGTLGSNTMLYPTGAREIKHL